MMGSDEDISTTDITIPPILIQGPITRSRARQLKQQVNSFLCSSSCENENRLLSNDVLVLRNEGEGHGVLMEHQGRAGEQGGCAPPVGSQVQPNFVINTVLIATSLFLLVFSVALAGISLLGEVIRVTLVITNGAVV